MGVKVGKKRIASYFSLANDPFSRMRGLMFRMAPSTILFKFDTESRYGNSIHSLFVFFRFDALFLNSNMKIVDIAEKVRPFRLLVTPLKPCKYVLELPAGTAEKFGLKPGQRVDLDE